MSKIKEQGNTNLKFFISMDLDKEENGIKSQKINKRREKIITRR